jgi:hypothetical protein
MAYFFQPSLNRRPSADPRKIRDLRLNGYVLGHAVAAEARITSIR